MSIQFINNGVSAKLLKRKCIKRVLLEVLKTEGYALKSIKYIFCTDKYLLHLNQQFLGHDTYTDIITFPLSVNGKPLIAEIYISIDRVIDNASIFKVSFQYELLRIIIHGLLHLCGYADKTPNDKKEMTRVENKYLVQYLEQCST